MKVFALGIRISAGFLLSLVICFLAQPYAASAQTQNKIEGLVLSSANKPLAGVLIRLYRGSTPLPNPARTKADGYYSVTFDSGSPITTVRYDLTNWYPSQVENISGARDHRINKVLLDTNTALTPQEQREVGATFAKLKAVDEANGITAEKFSAEYGVALTAFTKQLSPSKNVMWTHAYQDKFPEFQLPVNGSPEYGVNTSLVEISKYQAQRAGISSIRVNIEVTTVSSGWKVSTFQYVSGNTLHIYVTGQAPSAILSKSPATYLISETYDNLSGITNVIFHGRKSDVTVDLLKKP